MTQSHRQHKPAKFKYGTPDGWNFSNAIVAFRRTRRKAWSSNRPEEKATK